MKNKHFQVQPSRKLDHTAQTSFFTLVCIDPGVGEDHPAFGKSAGWFFLVGDLALARQAVLLQRVERKTLDAGNFSAAFLLVFPPRTTVVLRCAPDRGHPSPRWSPGFRIVRGQALWRQSKFSAYWALFEFSSRNFLWLGCTEPKQGGGTGSRVFSHHPLSKMARDMPVTPRVSR